MKPISAELLLHGIGALAANPQITAVVTDSRKVSEGCLFVCIKGERVDGHDYALSAVQNGAAGIVAQHAVNGVPESQTVLVPDVLDAMITMGGNYRSQFSPVLAGVTGSVGKTTTKEFCYAVLSRFGSAIKTEGNQNNEIGMPNTLFRLQDDTRFAVVEMGMQGLGEIHKLTVAAKPAAAVITNIGRSHLQQLGSRENILRAKLEICDGLPQGAPIILNADDDYLPHAALRADLQPVYVGIASPQAQVRAANLAVIDGATHFDIIDAQYGSFAAVIPAMGEHHVRDALSAYALGTRLGLPAAECARALADYQTTGYRQHIVRHGGVTVIEDCYNANPDSMAASLRCLAQYPAQGKRIAVLGDMFELGSITQSAHREIGALCAELKVDLLLCVGEASAQTADEAEAGGVRCRRCADNAQAVQTLCSEAKSGDAVLVKASNGMHFFEILSGFYAAYPQE